MEHKRVVQGRKSWVDIAKGILILLVILGHVQYFAHDFVGTDRFNVVGEFAFLFITWYMPAFFMITGHCSSFNQPFGKFAWKNFKALIIPSILIGVFMLSWLNAFLSPSGLSYQNFLQQDYVSILLTCGPWFLTALFLSKIACYCFVNYLHWRNRWKFLLLMVLMLFAASLYNKKVVYNLWYFEHALLLLPFMFVGFVLKEHKPWKHEKQIFMTLGGGSLVLVVVMKFLNLPYPYIVGIPGVFWGNFWLCIFMGISGSLMLFVICEWIGRCKWLEYLGRHTLTIYLLQEGIMVFMIKEYLNMGISLPIIVTVPVFVISTAFICAFLDGLIDKHVTFLKGKF